MQNRPRPRVPSPESPLSSPHGLARARSGAASPAPGPPSPIPRSPCRGAGTRPRDPPNRRSIPVGPGSAGVGGTSQRKARKRRPMQLYRGRQKFASSTQVASGAPGGGFGPPSQLGWRGDSPRAAVYRGSVRPGRGGPGKGGDQETGGGPVAPTADEPAAPLGSRAPRGPRSFLRLLRLLWLPRLLLAFLRVRRRRRLPLLLEVSLM